MSYTDFGLPTDPMDAPSNSAWAAAVADEIDKALRGALPIATIAVYPGMTAPEGWLMCHGQSVGSSIYPELFAAIGYTYGGSAEMFSLPNLSGRVAAGVDGSQGEFAALGDTGGEKSHVLTLDELASHNHGPRGGWGEGPANSGKYRVDINSPLNDWANTSDVGGGGAHNNLQPYLVVNYIIKAV